MRTIRIDFAPQGLRSALSRTSLLAYFLACVGLGLCIWAGFCAREILSRIDNREAALLHVRVKLSERSDSKPAVKKSTISDAQAHAVDGAIAQLNLPWRDAFDAIEAATPKSIALLALDPDAAREIMRGVAEAKSSDDMIAYIEQLKKQEFFDVVLLSKHEINEQDPNKPLRFQFEAHWKRSQP